MVSHPRAEIATVRIGHFEFEGLMLSDGTFYIGFSQLSSLNLVPPNRSLKQLEALYGIGFPSHQKLKTVLNSAPINAIDLKDFQRLLRILDKKGVCAAEALVDQLSGLSLQQLFSDAFCIQFEKEERQQWLKDRQEGKEKRRTLTDSIKDYLISHPHADRMLYPVVTDLIYLGIFNRRAAELKVDWNETNPRDEMTRKELSYMAEVEALTSRLIDRDGLHPLTAAIEALTRLIIPVCDR
jgi:hypothetical protein